MITFKGFLTEIKLFGKLKDDEVQVYQVKDFDQLWHLAVAAPHSTVRGMTLNDGDKIVAWPAGERLHHDAIRDLGLNRKDVGVTFEFKSHMLDKAGFLSWFTWGFKPIKQVSPKLNSLITQARDAGFRIRASA